MAVNAMDSAFGAKITKSQISFPYLKEMNAKSFAPSFSRIAHEIIDHLLVGK